MFTGIVTALGTVLGLSKSGAGMDLDLDLGGLKPAPRRGDSVAVSGVCCTVVRRRRRRARFHLSPETLDRTWLGRAQPGSRVNLEGALRAGDPLGGHLVQGHVDGLAEVVAPVDPAAGGDLVVRVPEAFLPYCVAKGSIALDGVSLTIAGLQGPEVRIAVIPHTAQATTLGQRQQGDPLHLEVDVLAKYVERLLAAWTEARGAGVQNQPNA